MVNSEYSIAIIGMAGRFPMAENIDQFWENLKEGKDCITLRQEEAHENFVSAYGRLDGIDLFDASFFEIPAAEAAASDPEQRIMMELSYHALEHAGYSSGSFGGKIGMYASFDNGVYVWNNIMQTGRDWYDQYQLYKAYLATRCEKIAYKLGFTGPAVMSEYACASSLNAVHQACQSLLNYECDMALAGGITAEPQQDGYPSHLATESTRGQIRPFDRDADGLVPGSAAGLVVLKRYEDAQKQHDHIIAVIRGTFVNNDGNRKAGFAAPSVFGQKECLESVLAVSELSPSDVSYYEAHGTGTDLGDSIELRAVKSVIGLRREGEKLYIGSVKSNIGHTNMAAGISNVIKTALVLQNRTLVPSLHYENPCSELLEETCPITVSTQTKHWIGNKPMTAVCSAVGMGGANAMAVLQEPERRKEQEPDKDTQSQLFLYSGKTKAAAERIREAAEAYVSGQRISLEDAAYTLQTGRGVYGYRTFSVMDKTGKAVRTQRVKRLDKEKTKRLVFVFSGVSNFERTIGRELYESDKIFRQYMDQCFQCCEDNGMPDIRNTFLNFIKEGTNQITADNMSGIQILFALGYSLAHTLMDLGIRPDQVMGHSNGEYIAAVISGIMTMEEAVRALKARALLMESLPEGGMLNIAEGPRRIKELLSGSVTIGAVNGPARTMAAGLKADIDRFEEILKKEAILYSRSPADRASHCNIMEGIAEDYRAVLEQIRWKPPAIRIVSSAEPDPEKNGEDMQTVDYWIRQMCKPVRFHDAVTAVEEEADSVFLEIGTGDALASIIRKAKPGKEAMEAYAVFDSPVAENSRNGFLAALGNLWCAGIAADWEKLYERRPYKVPLPLYPFERTSFWTYKRELNAAFCQENVSRKIRPEAALSGEKKEAGMQEESSGIAEIFRNPQALLADLKRKFFDKETILLLKDRPHYEEDGNRLVAACIMDYLKSSPNFDMDDIYTLEKLVYIMGVTQRYIPFIDYFLTFLSDYGYAKRDFGLIEFLEPAKKTEPKEEVLSQCKKRHPDCCAYMEFCVYASDHYMEVFTGNKEGSTVIYRDGTFDLINSYEARMPAYSYTAACLEALAEAAKKAVQNAGRKVRILEIGAGSGELTDRVLSRIGSEEIEYWFTDIKKSLVSVREERDREKQADFMRYGVLDISKDPKAQGYEEKSFDLVLLFDVIQATEDIQKTLDNLTFLLRDSGMCLFVQTCDGSELLNMIYGYAPGWWNYYGDPARTRISMPPERWREFLEDSGFRTVRSLPEDGASDAYLLMMQPPQAEKEEAASRTEEEAEPDRIQEQLLEIVQTVIGSELSPDDNLYELGMDSLMSMMISSKVQTQMHLDLQLSDLYGRMTVREIGEFLKTAKKTKRQEVSFAEPQKDMDDLLNEL